MKIPSSSTNRTRHHRTARKPKVKGVSHIAISKRRKTVKHKKECSNVRKRERPEHVPTRVDSKPSVQDESSDASTDY